MPLEHADEAQRLAEHYSQMYDGELLNLADDSDSLTEIAQQALRNEMKKRGLDQAGQSTAPSETPLNLDRPAKVFLEPSLRRRSPEPVFSAASEVATHEFTWKTPLCECDDEAQSWQITEVLRRAGIDSWVDRPSSRFFVKPIAINVAADQLDQAREIIAQPIPQDIVDDSKAEYPEYELPTCPHCGAADPILEDAEDGNSWACEACGGQWKDSAGDLGGKAGE